MKRKIEQLIEENYVHQSKLNVKDSEINELVKKLKSVTTSHEELMQKVKFVANISSLYAYIAT